MAPRSPKPKPELIPPRRGGKQPGRPGGDQNPERVRERREIFARAVGSGKSGTQAAKLAGYSARSAYMTANRLMRDDEVSALVVNAKVSIAQQLGITAHKVMAELQRMAFANIADFVTVDATDQNVTIDLTNVSREVMASVQEITTETYFDKAEERNVTRCKLKLYPKQAPLELLGKHLALPGFGSKLSITSQDGTQVATLENMTDEQLEVIAQRLIAQGEAAEGSDDAIEGT